MRSGAYSFRTIKPVAYPGRTPHIHFAITAPGREPLITQMYVAGEPQNERDGILNGIRDARQRDSVIVRLQPGDSLEPSALVGRSTSCSPADLASCGARSRAGIWPL